VIRIQDSRMSDHRESPHARRTGTTILTAIQAEEIYACKIKFSSQEIDDTWKCAKGQSKNVARTYHVSPKTVRDIWNHITWKYATCHLWGPRSKPVAVKPKTDPSAPLINEIDRKVRHDLE
jgi:hypothetical protein